jgi:prefoldin subunit 5
MKSTLLKLFLILNLLFCAGVVVFSIQIFRDREIVRARSVLHKNNLDRIAGNLNWGSPVEGEDEQQRQPSRFELVTPESMEDVQSITTTLKNLAAVAESRLSQLSKDHTRLLATREELKDTEERLAQKISELVETRRQVADLEASLTETRGSLEDVNRQVAVLRGEIQTLEVQIEDLDRQIASREETESKLTRQLEIRTGERDRIETLLAAARRPVNRDGSVTDWHEKTGQVLAAELDWNYVVIDKGEVDVLPLFLEAFVHRGDDFIGKIRITQVERTVALAEVLVDTLVQGKTIEAGDTIFF